MWYLICLGIGLAIGIAFLIWALTERSARSKAELALKDSNALCNNYAGKLTDAKVLINGLQDAASRQLKVVEALRAALRGAEQRLVECKDPEAVRKWLAEELKGETL